MNVLLRTCPFCGAIPHVTNVPCQLGRVVELKCTCPVGPSVIGTDIEAVASLWNKRSEGGAA